MQRGSSDERLESEVLEIFLSVGRPDRDLYSEGSIYLERDKKSGIGVDIIKETDSSTRNSMNISSASRKEAGFV